MCYYITADLLSQAADFERLESLVDKTQQDKRRLGVRVNRLTQTGELVVINIKSVNREPIIEHISVPHNTLNRNTQILLHSRVVAVCETPD